MFSMVWWLSHFNNKDYILFCIQISSVLLSSSWLVHKMIFKWRKTYHIHNIPSEDRQMLLVKCVTNLKMHANKWHHFHVSILQQHFLSQVFPYNVPYLKGIFNLKNKYANRNSTNQNILQDLKNKKENCRMNFNFISNTIQHAYLTNLLFQKQLLNFLCDKMALHRYNPVSLSYCQRTSFIWERRMKKREHGKVAIRLTF